MTTNRAAFLCFVWIWTAIIGAHLLAPTATPDPSPPRCETGLVPPTDIGGGI